jgi:phosphonate transport system substrate-binding protein
MNMNMTLRFRKTGFLLKICLLLVFLIQGCSDDRKSVDVLHVGIVPHEDKRVQREKYKSLFEYMKSSTGLDYVLHVPDSYEQLSQWFAEKKVNIALFGGVTYVRAHLRHGAVPLVLRDVDGRFRSVVLARADEDSNIARLEDLQGQTFAFGSRLSTSGHLMPRHFFGKLGLVPEKHFGKIEYSGAHDRTAEWVRDGRVVAGVANSGIVNEMFNDGRLSEQQVKVIWESPTYVDYVWAVQSDFPEDGMENILAAFLRLSQGNGHKEILQKMGANYYIPARVDDFSALEKIVVRMERQGLIQ